MSESQPAAPAAAARWRAPDQVSAITLSVGTLTVADGGVDVPESASAADRMGLVASGFRLIVDPPAPAKPAKTKTEPADPASASN